MNKYVLILIISIISLSVQGQDSTWTIVKTNPYGEFQKSRAGYFWAGPSLKEKLGKVRPGTKVYPIEQSGSVYHVRFKDGQIGWVDFTMLKETQKLEITKNTTLNSIKGSGSFRMGKFIDSLKKGDIVTQFGIGEGGGVRHVTTKKGKKGAVIRQYAIPVVEKDVPEYNSQEEYQFHFKDEIDTELLQKSDSLLRKKFGNPGALVFNKNNDTWYYTNIETYSNGLRYDGIKFFVNDNIVVSDSVIGKGSSTFIDKLPLYLPVKKINLFKTDGSKKVSLFKNVSKRHWTIRMLIRVLQFIIGILLISLAHFLSMFITMRIARISSLSNGIVLLIGYSLSISLNYLYYIYLLAHAIQQPYFLTFVMAVVLYFSLRTITRRINYHRCPQCRTMWTAEDKGSRVTGKTHITQNKSESRLTGSHTNSDGQKVDTYSKFEWQEKMTEKQIKDLRYCNNCGFRWNVDRVEKVAGHV